MSIWVNIWCKSYFSWIISLNDTHAASGYDIIGKNEVIIMKVIHFNKCQSTQIYLKDNYQSLTQQYGDELLVTTANQKQGIGRNGSWDYFSNSLAFSFTIKPHKQITLTPLEIAVLIVKWVADNYHVNLSLKWPNDVLTQNREKCAGILVNMIDENTAIVGIGINLGPSQQDNKTSQYKTPFSYVLESLEDDKNNDFKETLPITIYQYILDNRITAEKEVSTFWNQHCCHLLENIMIIDELFHEELAKGQFQGISEQGEALIKDKSGKVEKFLNGSLYFLDDNN